MNNKRTEFWPHIKRRSLFFQRIPALGLQIDTIVGGCDEFESKVGGCSMSDYRYTGQLADKGKCSGETVKTSS